MSDTAGLSTRIHGRLTRAQRRLLLGSAAALLVALLGLWFWVPSLAEGRAQAKLASLGLAFEAQDISAGLSSVSFEGVAIRDKADARLLAKIDRIDAGFSLWARSITGVEVQGVALELAVDDLARRLAQRRAAARPAAEAGSERRAPGRAQPPIRLTHGSLSLRDRHGPLLQVQSFDVAYVEGTFTAQADGVVLGEKLGESIALHRAALVAVRDGGRFRVQKASIHDADLRWRSENLRSRDTRLKARLMAVRAQLRGAKPAGGSQPAAAASDKDGTLWTPDAQIDFNGVRVVDLGSDGAEDPLLERLSMQVRADGGHALKLTGQGAAPRGGSIKWDVRAVPDELRVEGQLNLNRVSLALFAPVLPPLPFHELDRSRISADLSLAGRGLESAEVTGSLSVHDLAFFSEGLAREPVGPFSLSATGEATWVPARRELSGVLGTIDVGAVSVLASGNLAWPTDGYRVDLLLALPKTACADLLAAVPSGLLADLDTIQMAGEMTAKLTAQVDSADLDATKLDFDIKDRCTFKELPEILALSRFEQPFVHQVLEPDGTLFEFETGPGTPAWTPIEEISPFMLQAVIAHEDGRFLRHEGFAEAEIGAALARNLKARAFRFGASTITMQLVKNVFLHRDKLLSRKVQEALIVWWLEQAWDKRRILELYLNVIEYGPAVYGIRNAAAHYFGTIPLHLTPAQCAFLAMILPSPKSSHVYYERGKLSESMKRRTARFLEHMHARERIDDEALAFGLEQLESFQFYDPAKPPPLPLAARGTAQPLPFMGGQELVDPWEELDFKDVYQEGGSY